MPYQAGSFWVLWYVILLVDSLIVGPLPYIWSKTPFLSDFMWYHILMDRVLHTSSDSEANWGSTGRKGNSLSRMYIFCCLENISRMERTPCNRLAIKWPVGVLKEWCRRGFSSSLHCWQFGYSVAAAATPVMASGNLCCYAQTWPSSLLMLILFRCPSWQHQCSCLLRSVDADWLSHSVCLVE